MNMPDLVMPRELFNDLPMALDANRAESPPRRRYLCDTGQWLLLGDPQYPGAAVLHVEETCDCCLCVLRRRCGDSDMRMN